MSPTLSQPLTCLVLLLFLFSGQPSTAGTSISFTTNTRAHVFTRPRRAKQSNAGEFLLAHNVARAASGVPLLKWDKGLARFAHKWANQQKLNCNMNHSNGPYGENIFWYQQKNMWSPENVVMRWFNERLNYDLKTNTCALGEMCGHYTQIVWRGTTTVGCARVKCYNNRGYLVVCEYNPRGNYEGESPFDHIQ